MQAEREAHEIVSKARKYRQDKLKQAKKDAATEINNYKLQKDKELTNFANENAGSVDDLEKNADLQVQDELKDIERVAKEKKEDVIKLLIDAVTHPSAELHANAI